MSWCTCMYISLATPLSIAIAPGACWNFKTTGFSTCTLKTRYVVIRFQQGSKTECSICFSCSFHQHRYKAHFSCFSESANYSKHIGGWGLCVFKLETRRMWALHSGRFSLGVGSALSVGLEEPLSVPENMNVLPLARDGDWIPTRTLFVP